MDWREQNRLLAAERLLDEAVELLRKYGECDPYTGQPYDEVVDFLRRDEVLEALS